MVEIDKKAGVAATSAPSREAQLITLTILHSLVAEQEQELQRLRLPPGALANGEELFAWYMKSNRFRQLYGRTKMSYLGSRSKEEVDGVHSHFVGGAYEDMAYAWFASSQQPASQVLLSPARTLRFYQALYPKNPKIRHPPGMDSLKGISVPDGILVKKANDERECVLAICEYTSTDDERNFTQKYTSFDMDRKSFPGIFADAAIIFVLPKQTLLRKILGDIVRMPFTHQQFRVFIGNVLFNFSLTEQEDTARLIDFRTRVEEQLARIKERQDSGRGLTPEEEQYLLGKKGYCIY